MSLQILNSEQQVLTGNIQTNHNGFTGGAEEVLIYLRNDFPEYYYEDITLRVRMPDLEENALFSQSGWSIKLSNTSEQPTEKEWGEIFVNETLRLPNIGSAEVANTEGIFPVWIRVYCPGHSLSDIKQDMSLSLKYSKKMVSE